MHIFLLGPLNAGKSTVIKNTVSKLRAKADSLSLGGFVTYKANTRVNEGDPYIFMRPAGEDGRKSAVAIAKFGANSPVCIAGVLDTFGADILRKSHSRDLICMDELGFIERDALLFQREVFRCLDCGKPVLGVLRDREIPWHRYIREHKDVATIKVTEENRDSLPEQLCEMFLRYLASAEDINAV